MSFVYGASAAEYVRQLGAVARRLDRFRSHEDLLLVALLTRAATYELSGIASAAYLVDLGTHLSPEHLVDCNGNANPTYVPAVQAGRAEKNRERLRCAIDALAGPGWWGRKRAPTTPRAGVIDFVAERERRARLAE
jgi:hypothetical protein